MNFSFSIRVAGENSKTVRVLSWNLYNRPWTREARFENMKRTLIERNPDLVALQEVSTGWILPGDPMKIFASVFSGFFSAREWHESNAGVFRTGLGFFSRWPLHEIKYTEFNENPFWDAKGFYQARVEIPGNPLVVFNVHLASTDDRKMKQSQLDQLGTAVSEAQKKNPGLSILIVGDWNLEWKSPQLEGWLKSHRADSLFAHLPNEKIHATWSSDYTKTCAGDSKPGEIPKEIIDHIVWIPSSTSERKPLRWISGAIGVSPLTPHPSDHCYIESTFAF